MSWATDRLDALKQCAKDLPPVVQTLKLGTLNDWGPGWVRKHWQPDAAVLNADGSLFGGYVAALADQMAALAALSVVPDGMAIRTLQLGIQFFRIGIGEPLEVEGRVISQTRAVIAVEVECRRARDGALLAKASAQQLVMAMAAARSIARDAP